MAAHNKKTPLDNYELDDRYRRNRYWCEVDLSMLPSEYYERNCKVGLVSDQFGVQTVTASIPSSRAASARAISR